MKLNGTDKCTRRFAQTVDKYAPISDELYEELVKEFNNERHYFFNDSL